MNRVDDEKAELQEELENARDMSDMAQKFTEAMMQSGGDSSAPSQKVDELVDERNELRRKLEQREDRIGELKARVSQLEEYEARVEQSDTFDIEEAEEAIHRLQEALNVEIDGEAEKWRRKYQQERQELRERVAELEAENDRLRSGNRSWADDGDVESLLNHEAVQAAIDSAIENSKAAGDNFDPVLSVLATADGEPRSPKEIAAPLSISPSTVRRMARSLYNAGVVQKEGNGPEKFTLNRDFIEKRIEVA